MNEGDIAGRLRSFILTDLLRNPHYPLQDNEPLITGGLLDSFAIAQIGVWAEKEFGVYIPDSDMTHENMDTVQQMARRIAQGLTS